MEKVNWINEYKIDNTFNVVMYVVLFLLYFSPLAELSIIIIVAGLYINISASMFFNPKKYQQRK